MKIVNYSIKRFLLLSLFVLIFLNNSTAQIPVGYYDAATGTGSVLKTQLYNIIKNPSVTSYTGLWTSFQSTDVDSYYENDGTVLDMYSENPTGVDPYNFSYTADQCGTYGIEGDCYNREHSFPKSWFSSASPMYSDLFHIYPTDGKVNGMRSNYPYGPNNGESFTSLNGSKLGTCTASGYTGTVFEPIDEFKGDLARSYFYMVTCYENLITGWTSDVLDGTTYPGYNQWFLDILIEWNNLDPVSQKEIDRNNAIYAIQGNRNPYIDHPEWVCEVFNSPNCSSDPTIVASPLSISDFSYIIGFGPSSSQSFSLSGSNLDGSQVTITAPTNYEISTDNSTFSASLNVSYSAPTLSSTTIYVRLKSGLSVGTYNSELITCSDNGTASNVTVNLDGQVTELPLFCDDFEDNLNDWAVTNDADPSANIVISSTWAGANSTTNSALFDCPNPSTDTYYTSYIEKTFTNSQNLSVNFWYYFEDYRGGEITIYVNNVEQYSIYTDGTGNLAISATDDDLWKEINVDLSSATSSIGNYTIKIEGISKASSTWKDRVAIDELCVFGNQTSSPALSVTPTTLNGYTYVEGAGPSTSLSFSLSGSNLDGSQVTVTAPTNYEISTDNSTFSASLNVSYTALTLSSTTIYVRLKSGLSVGTYNSELITCSDNGTASNVTVSNDGEVTATPSPTLSVTPTTLNGYTYVEGAGPSTSQSFSLSGSNLDGSQVTVTAPTNYEISTDNSTFSASINVSYTAPTLSSTTIYVRLKSGLSIGTYNSELITCSDNGTASNVTVSNDGEVTAAISSSCEDFDDQTGNSYLTTFTTDDFGDWTALSAGNFDLGTPRSGISCVAINDNTSGAQITTPSFNTVGTVSFWYYQRFGDTNDEFQFQISEDGGAFSTLATQSFNIGTTYTLFSYDVNSSSSDVKIRVLNDNMNGHLIIDDFCVTNYTQPTPSISVTPSTLSGFSYILGSGPSTSQSFDISGSNLDGSQVTITAPTNYEVSTDNSTFATSVNVSYTATTLSSTTIYVRLKAGLSVGTYNSELVTCSDNGTASNQIVTINGEVLQPVLSVAPSSLTNLNYSFENGPSVSQNFDISGSNLDGSEITITAPTNYEVSTDNSTFANSVNVSYTAPTLSSTTIYVRLKAGLSVGTYNSELITCSDNGTANSQNVNVSGEVRALTSSCASDLIISEIIESGTDKYLEIANYSGSPINLTNYDLVIYSNGDLSPTLTIDLNDASTINDQEVYVISYSGSNNWTGTVNQTSADLSFNGNDVIALRKNSTNIDVFGTIGNSIYFYDDQIVIRDIYSTTPTNTYNNSDWNFSTYSGEDPSSLGSHSLSCFCTQPTSHDANMIFSSVTSSSIDVSWTNGDGINRIVVAKQNSPVNWTPIDNNTYTANSAFGSGTVLGDDNYVVFNGSGNNFSLTNLTAGTTYYFEIFEYNCQIGTEDYYSSGIPEQNFETTLPTEVSNFQLICGTGSNAELSWNLPIGNFDGILITGLQGTIPDAPTCDGNSLTNPITDFGIAEEYCSNLSGSVYLFNNIGTNVSITGLTPNLSYDFVAYVYKNSAWSSGTTLNITSQVSNISNLNSICGNSNSELTWTNPNSACFDEILIVAHSSSSVTSNPSGDGTLYTANADFGSGTDIGSSEFVVYKGSGESTTITNLTNGIDYYYKVFVRSGSEWSSGIEINCTPSTATILDYNDLAIVGVNTDIDDAGAQTTDEIQFICFKDITPETNIDLTDNGFERLYADKWADSEGTIRITRNNSTLPANSLIVLQGQGQAANWHVFIGDGTNSQTFINDDANWTITDGGTGNNQFDLNASDQIWIMQGGNWINPLDAHNATYSGKVIYGWTASGWETSPGYDNTSGSTLFSGSNCSQTNVVGVPNQDKVKYNSSISEVSQREWISRFNNDANWTGYISSTDYFNGGTLPDTISVSGSGFSSLYQWTGETNSDWNECTNWLNLKIPDSTSNVIFVSDNCANDIIVAQGDTLICNNLTIQGSTANYSIKLESVENSVLRIYGNLTIDIASILDFDDGNSSTPDGKIVIYGNWINNSGDLGFLEGNSTVEFAGETAQSIYNSDSHEDFYNLFINNSSNDGVSLNKNIIVSDTILLDNGLLDLNGQNLTISGDYLKTNGIFKGNSASDINVDGSGILADFNFSDTQIINDFTLNRSGKTAVFSSNLNMSDLIIISGIVQLNAGKFFTVSNTLTNNVGTSGLILKSDANGTASLIHYSENVPATCERYINGGIWSYYFSPLSNIPTYQLSSANELYYYDETKTDYWLNYDAFGETSWLTEGSLNLSTDKGYIVYSKNSKVFTMTGGNLFYDATNNNKIFNLSYTDSGTGAVNQDGVTADWDVFEGWNLIGNPFSSAFDWNQVLLSNAENVIYYYDGINKNYKYYGAGTTEGISVNGGSQFIPANQSFFIKATSSGASVTIPNTARTHNSQIYLKKNILKNVNIIRLKVGSGINSDETVIHFTDNATKYHDNFDAYKFYPNSIDIPMIYSIDDNNLNYAINNLPFDENLNIKLGYYAPTAGTYNIILETGDIKDFHIYIKDNEQYTTTNIQNFPTYEFYYDGGTNINRFELLVIKNREPYVINPIEDFYVNTNEQFNINLINNTFADPDLGDYLTYSCLLSNGQNLPKTIIFENGSLNGIFTDTISLDITIKASDKFGLTSSQDFKLFAIDNEKNENSHKNFIVYPNPADNILYLYIPQAMKNTFVNIFDATGKKVFQKIISDEENSFNISNLNSGIYIIEVYNEIISEKQKLIIK